MHCDAGRVGVKRDPADWSVRITVRLVKKLFIRELDHNERRLPNVQAFDQCNAYLLLR